MNKNILLRAGQSGMTLIELMVVVVIVAILAAIAYPTYRQQVVRSKRTDAKVALQQTAQSLENCFTRFHEYGNEECAIVVALRAAAGIPSNDGYYRVTALDDDLGGLTFLLTATPQGEQAADTQCANFTLDHDNQRDVSGPKGRAECWR